MGLKEWLDWDMRVAQARDVVKDWWKDFNRVITLGAMIYIMLAVGLICSFDKMRSQRADISELKIQVHVLTLDKDMQRLEARIYIDSLTRDVAVCHRELEGALITPWRRTNE